MGSILRLPLLTNMIGLQKHFLFYFREENVLDKYVQLKKLQRDIIQGALLNVHFAKGAFLHEDNITAYNLQRGNLANLPYAPYNISPC